MTSTHRLAVSTSEHSGLARGWQEQDYDLRSAAESLSAGTAHLPPSVTLGLRQFLAQWSAEIELRAADCQQIALGLNQVVTTTVEIDRQWGTSQAWGSPA